MTNHDTRFFRILPYELHLGVDFAVGAMFVVTPIVLGFEGMEFWYFVVLGVTVLAVVGLHKPEQEKLVVA